ncbi:hypothetical protein MPTK1_2g00220 [Marchantia polymorpha subsp. ruderalis]|uniref:Uncharacterized protein n=1 Tax=Marchantia polymorpha TaxID=3197 RepID=A0A2R6X9P9_MARPO|nr:hypothetical protein MARPO_0028s0129 [Marchantia polymorpha]BBN00560.1 hypothetical protein Mp_2g00220 [Marchantia polymorpha subsp. ruderalis]|eukprot:PTQ42837.1 hypothetical protein MARPO_0028s0129 [Marchantia polymorpha]
MAPSWQPLVLLRTILRFRSIGLRKCSRENYSDTCHTPACIKEQPKRHILHHTLQS